MQDIFELSPLRCANHVHCPRSIATQMDSKFNALRRILIWSMSHAHLCFLFVQIIFNSMFAVILCAFQRTRVKQNGIETQRLRARTVSKHVWNGYLDRMWNLRHMEHKWCWTTSETRTHVEGKPVRNRNACRMEARGIGARVGVKARKRMCGNARGIKYHVRLRARKRL